MPPNDKRQVSAVPVRTSSRGLDVMLVTSRETGRWVIPKGWCSPRLSDWEAAAREAQQEAGARGAIWPEPIGNYTYVKRMPGEDRLIKVEVFLLLVTKLLERWPEQQERRREWMSPRQAARRVHEPGLKKILTALADVTVTPVPAPTMPKRRA